jgi:hypothetical protein
MGEITFPSFIHHGALHVERSVDDKFAVYKKISKTSALAFDTCTYFSLLFEEDTHTDKLRAECGTEAKELFNNLHRDYNYFRVVLDTVSWELYTIISHKVHRYIVLLNQMFKEYEKRVEEGLRTEEISRILMNDYIEREGFKEIYDYFLQRGYGFFNLLKDQTRLKFLNYLRQLPKDMMILFNSFNKKIPRMFYKEKIIRWLNNKKAKKGREVFMKTTTGIGRKDRIHILACYIYSVDRQRSIMFVTTDELLIEKGQVALEKMDKLCNALTCMGTKQLTS